MKVVEFLRQKGVEGLVELTETLGIIVKEYEDLYVLNYDQINSPKLDPITVECRGLILDKSFNVVSRSFDRFLNYGESGCGENLDIKTCSVVEKVDGSLIKIYNFEDKWYVSTRGTAYAESEVGDFGITFKDLVLKALNISNDETFQRVCNNHMFFENTYIFEVTSRENRVVTRYDGYKLWFLGCRNNETGKYLNPIDAQYTGSLSPKNFSFTSVDAIKSFGAFLPKTFSFNTIGDMISASKELPNLEEGYVIYQKGAPVCKVKSPLYLTVHRIRGEGSLTNKRIMQLLLMNEQDEYLTYYPEDEKFFTPWRDTYKDLLCRIANTYNKYKDIKDQKEFALNVKDEVYSAVLFQARAKELNPIICWHQQSESYKLKVLERYSECQD